MPANDAQLIQIRREIVATRAQASRRVDDAERNLRRVIRELHGHLDDMTTAVQHGQHIRTLVTGQTFIGASALNVEIAHTAYRTAVESRDEVFERTGKAFRELDALLTPATDD